MIYLIFRIISKTEKRMKNKDFFSYLYVTRNGMSFILILAVQALFFICSRKKTKEVHF